MSHASVVDDRRTDLGPTGRRRARRTGERIAGGRRRFLGGVVALVLLGVFAAVLAGAMSAGMRAFDVRTPSMGTTAPVGTLVVTRPVTAASLHVGDVISFRPPSVPGSIYTHRVVALDGAGTAGVGIATRGDANGARDAWTLHDTDLVGRAVLVLPGVGWAVRALPMLAVGVLVVWLGAAFLRRPDHRIAARVLGVSTVVSVVPAVLRPFVATTLIETTANTDHPVAVVISTGLLPTRVSVPGGGSALLHDGEVARLALPDAAHGAYHLAAGIELPVLGWVLYLAIAAVPMVLLLLIGAPRRRTESAR